MMEDTEEYAEDPQVPSSLNLPLLSKDNETWEEFGADIVADAALRGEWKDDNTRALLWRLLLGVIPRALPPSEWAKEMSNKRAQHRQLAAEHRVDIVNMSANPLFPGTGSGDDPWSHFYERKEMTDTIKADLERLFPTGCGDHFLAPARQELLLSVLSLWADLHAATAYRQGMHEVLAPIILALEKEAAAAARDMGASTVRGPAAAATATAAAAARKTSSWLGRSTVDGVLLDASTHPGAAAILGRGSTPADLEADAFWLFSAVMKGLEGFYEHGKNAAATSAPSRAGPGSGRPVAAAGGGGVDSPVVDMCKRLQGPRMREADPVLQRHLAELDISPQLYGMKWARLMFGREFRVESVLLLWDHIFASFWIEGRPDMPECIENVALAMVVSIRDQLLAEDSTGCLQLLMRYPPDQSVSSVISLSLSGGHALDPELQSPRPHPSPVLSFGPDPPLEQLPNSAWLNGAGGNAGTDFAWFNGVGDAVEGYRRSTSAAGSVSGRGGQERRRDSYSGGGDGWGGARTGRESWRARGNGRDPRDRERERDRGIGAEGETRNNWQQGLDDFTRRAFSAAQGVAKLAVQTVERNQGGGDSRQRPQSLPASEAFNLARRLRAACTAMEAGETSVNLAAQEIKEVARLLEVRSGGHSNSSYGSGGGNFSSSGYGTSSSSYGNGGSEACRTTRDSRSSRTLAGGGGTRGGGGGGQAVTRGFSTYSEDDGCADSLYTRDL